MQMLGIFVANAVIDLLFLLAWVGIHHLAGLAFAWLGDLTGLDRVVLRVLELILSLTTLTVILSYVVWDFIQTVKRIWGNA